MDGEVEEDASTSYSSITLSDQNDPKQDEDFESSNPFVETSPKNEFCDEASELEALPWKRRLLICVIRLQKVAIPLFCLQILSYLCIVTDVIFVGRIGTTELAAMGLGGAWQSCVAFIAYNISTLGLYSMISQAHGRSDTRSKGLALQTALVVGLVLSLFPVGPLLWFSAEILSLSNVTDPKLLLLLSYGGKISWAGVVMEVANLIVSVVFLNKKPVSVSCVRGCSDESEVLDAVFDRSVCDDASQYSVSRWHKNLIFC